MSGTPKIKLLSKDWQSKPVRVYGSKYTIHTEAAGEGQVTLILEQGKGTVRFLGVEKHENNPRSEFAGDRPAVVKSLGPESVAQSAWLRLYRESERRRASFEDEES